MCPPPPPPGLFEPIMVLVRVVVVIGGGLMARNNIPVSSSLMIEVAIPISSLFDDLPSHTDTDDDLFRPTPTPTPLLLLDMDKSIPKPTVGTCRLTTCLSVNNKREEFDPLKDNPATPEDNDKDDEEEDPSPLSIGTCANFNFNEKEVVSYTQRLEQADEVAIANR